MNEQVGKRYFIPMSIGNHYYSNRVLTRILFEVTPVSSESIIFVCDRLRQLVLRARGVLDEDEIARRVRNEVAQVRRRLVNCGMGDIPNVIVGTWDLLDQDPAFQRIRSALEEVADTCLDVRAFLRQLVVSLVGTHFEQTNVDERLTAIQTEYVLEETALSLFMTEVMGYRVEFYRRMDTGLIVFLYQQRPELLNRMLGKPDLDRTFVSLEALFAAEVPNRKASSKLDKETAT